MSVPPPAPPRHLDPLSLGAILVTIVFWASAFTGIRIGLESFTPGHLALYRFLVASATLLIYLAALRLPLPAPRDLWQILGLSVLGISLYHAMLNYGEMSVPAGTASLIIATGPVITALLSTRFLGERLNLLGWLGTLVSLGGVALIVLGKGESVNFTQGALLIVGAAFFTSLYFVFQRGVVSRVGALPFTVWSLILGTLPLLVFAPNFLTEWRAAPLAAHLAVIYLGIFPSALAYMTWTFAISRVGANITSSFLYVSPIFALLMAWALLGEVPSALTLIGGVVALAGVVLVNLWGRPRA